MLLSDSQVKAEQAGPRRSNVYVGDSLSVLKIFPEESLRRTPLQCRDSCGLKGRSRSL